MLSGNFGRYTSADDRWLSNRNIASAGQQQHIRYCNAVADIAFELVDFQNVPGGHIILLAAGPNHCVHVLPFLRRARLRKFIRNLNIETLERLCTLFFWALLPVVMRTSNTRRTSLLL